METIKPISIVAFLLALVAVVLMLTALFLPRWYVLFVPGGGAEAWHGLWQQQKCNLEGCQPYEEFTKIEGGREFYFVAKVFETIAGVMSLGSFILHAVYAVLRHPLVRQISIYSLCGAGLFGLLATFIFVGQYGQLFDYKGQEVALGSCFWLSLFGSLVCLVASAFTAWASYRKANYLDEDDDDTQQIEEIQHADFEAEPPK